MALPFQGKLKTLNICVWLELIISFILITGDNLLTTREHDDHGPMQCPWSGCAEKFNDLNDLWDHFCDKHTPYHEYKSNILKNGPQSSLHATQGSTTFDLDKDNSLTTTETDAMDLDLNMQNSSTSIEHDQQAADIDMENVVSSEIEAENVSNKHSDNFQIILMKVEFF
jgi:hypothetical protein